jgi:2Fe-2S ferredoxin
MIKIRVIDLEGREHELDARKDELLMDVLREQDWGVAALCGGMCSCGTCHVFIDDEWLERLPERDSGEMELLESLDHFRPNSRLSCQLRMRPHHNGLSLMLAPEE